MVYFITEFITCHVTEGKGSGNRDDLLFIETLFTWYYDDGDLFDDIKK